MFIRLLTKVAETIIPFPNNNLESFKNNFTARAKEFFANMAILPRITFSVILILIQLTPMLRYLRPFSKLSIEKRKKVVEKWYTSKIMTKRLMINAIKGLCTMIYLSLQGDEFNFNSTKPKRCEKITQKQNLEYSEQS